VTLQNLDAPCSRLSATTQEFASGKRAIYAASHVAACGGLAMRLAINRTLKLGSVVDLYSDLLGGGRRRFFNPYIGFRAGYAQSGGSGDLAVGGLIAADLWKSKNALLELGVRALALIGNDRGAHLMIGPHLAFDFAF